MEHNHQYVFVKKVILQTDQKALVLIMPKPLASAPKKLECLVTTSYQPLPFRSRSETQWNREREICDPTLQWLKSKILNGFPDTKDDLPAVILPSHSRRASSTSVSRRYNMTTRQSHMGKTKNWPVTFCNTWQAPSSGDQTITCRTKHK